VKVRKIQQAREAKIAIFDDPLSFEAPAPVKPREYSHKPSFARNSDPWATFLTLTLWVNLHSNFCGGLRETYGRCNVTRCIIAVQGQFRVIQGHWFSYQSKAHIRLHISISSNLGPILHHFGDTVAYRSKNRQNRQFIPTQSHKSPSLGVTPIKFHDEPNISEN